MERKIATAKVITGHDFAVTYSTRIVSLPGEWMIHAYTDAFGAGVTIGHGTAGDCMAALDRYVAQHASIPAMAAE